MKKVAILLADGFEEIEAITPKDVLSRANIECHFFSIMQDFFVTGAHNIVVKADKVLQQGNNLQDYDIVILPGGMPGAKNLSENTHVISILKQFNEQNKYISAICASPAIALPKANIEKSKRITSYPGMEKYLKNAVYVEDDVVQDGNIITSRGPATALAFSYKIVDALIGNSQTIKDGMLYK